MLSPLLRDQIRSQLTGGRRWASPLDLACDLDKRIVRTPALELINAKLVEAFDTPDGRLAISMPPQEGKTTLVVQYAIPWALQQNPDLPVILSTYNQSLANRGGRLVRNLIEGNPRIGLSVAPDNGSKHEWSLAGRDGGLISAGRGVGISGRPAGLVIIDDPFKEGEAASEIIRDDAWDTWTEGLSARLAPGASVAIVHTRWHEDDLIGRLLERDAHAGWVYVNVPAQCEDPINDPLGRTTVGEFMISARGRSQRQWEQRKLTAGSRVWNALYQGRPAPAEGGLVKRDWFRRYSVPLWEDRDGQRFAIGFDEILISADLAFKAKADSDYVSLGVWGRRGQDAYLLDRVRGHFDFITTVRRFVDLTKLWPQAVLKLVEDKANGPALINMLSRRIVGIVPLNPSAGKIQRALAWTPLAESGHVYLPDEALCPWVGEYVEELASFPNAKHDDDVDMTSQALDRLLLRPLLQETHDSYDDDLDDYRIGY